MKLFKYVLYRKTWAKAYDSHAINNQGSDGKIVLYCIVSWPYIAYEINVPCYDI